MSKLQQATDDLAISRKYVDLFEHRLGKKASASLRRMLMDAVMAGIKHGRETAKSPQEREYSELMDKLTRKGFR